MAKYVKKEDVLKILRQNLSNGYRDVDGDYVEGRIDRKAISDIEKLHAIDAELVEVEEE